jgi:hypothetical protein
VNLLVNLYPQGCTKLVSKKCEGQAPAFSRLLPIMDLSLCKSSSNESVHLLLILSFQPAVLVIIGPHKEYTAV